MQQKDVEQPTIPHNDKIAKQVRQIHKAVVKPEPAQWPPVMIPTYVDHS
jgi:hypothetical protein